MFVQEYMLLQEGVMPAIEILKKSWLNKDDKDIKSKYLKLKAHLKKFYSIKLDILEEITCCNTRQGMLINSIIERLQIIAAHNQPEIVKLASDLIIAIKEKYAPWVFSEQQVLEGITKLKNIPIDEIPLARGLPTLSRMEFSPKCEFRYNENMLKATAQVFKSPSTNIAPVAVLTGGKNTGKSQLACEFVHRYGQYFAGGVIWVNCTQKDFSTDAQIFASGKSARNAQDYDSLSLTTKEKLIRYLWSSPIPRLVVFDNCEDPRGVLGFWQPIDGGTNILITTRKVEWYPNPEIVVLPINGSNVSEPLPIPKLALLNR